MKKHYLSLLAIASLAISTSVFSYNSLTVNSPDGWWWEVQGTIEEATFTVEPKGIYTEVGMYLTFSAATHGFGLQDTLEIVFDFHLPKGAMVHDSWLWVGDVIVKADILDIWSATTIYEDIVDRRRDPSVLYKKSDGSYQLRVYPLAGTETRKVKITYLSPTIWTESEVATLLPVDILGTSLVPLPQFRVITLPDAQWESPALQEFPNQAAQPGYSTVLGSFLFWDLNTALVLPKPLTFKVKAPWNDGVFVSRLEDAGEQFFQLAYSPQQSAGLENPKKMVFVFDNKPGMSSVEKKDLYAFTKGLIKKYLGAADSFNLVFPDGWSSEHFDTWHSAEPATIDASLDAFGNDPISTNTNIRSGLEFAIDFIKAKGGEGEILMFAASNHLDWDGAGSFTYETILDDMDGAEIPIHVLNYQTEQLDEDWYWNGTTWVELPRNGLFYQNITQATGGELIQGAIWESLYSFFTDLKGVPGVFDLHPSFESGFSFQRYLPTYPGRAAYLNQPIFMVGKYQGNFPMTLDFAAIIGDSVVFETKTVQGDQAVASDSLTREIWVGNHIHSLEGFTPSNPLIQDIIDISIEERVLSNYTAFLALEPGMGGEPCWNCWEGGGVVISTKEEAKPASGVSVSASPNPFKNQCRLTFELEELAASGEITIAIFDAFGKLVKTFEAETLKNTGNMQSLWNGENEQGEPLPGGIYFLVVSTDKGKSVVKLVHLN